jgi:hypothetical protein
MNIKDMYYSFVARRMVAKLLRINDDFHLFGMHFGYDKWLGHLYIRYHIDYENGESWKLLTIGGAKQETEHCQHPYDCCGNAYCWLVKAGLFGIWSIGYYHLNV